MLNLYARIHGKVSKEFPPDGKYSSVVTDVRWANNHGYQGAYEIVYEITSEDGCTYRHSEIFLNAIHNKRTAKFEAYITDHGIDDLINFKGKKEYLTLERQTINGREYFDIVSREFANEG